ncbi:hypothetical protein GCM10023339_07650 [Alloalcanivorax gelatiniphagus]
MSSWRVLLVAAVALAGQLLPAGATDTASATPPGARSSFPCGTSQGEFIPTRLSVPGLVGPTRVLALGRDRNGVPRTPPLTDAGKWQVAYDRSSGIRPGGLYGVVRFTAHTYPWSGRYGSALGNRLLQRLHVGSRIVLTGPDGQRLCYTVSRRQQVRASSRMSGYYSSTGPSRLALLVCSGTRRGPGDWSHRTIWYATPS